MIPDAWASQNRTRKEIKDRSVFSVLISFLIYATHACTFRFTLYHI